MWSDLEHPWQAAWEEAWQAYRSGSVPIGAIIVGSTGEILARGRNHIFDSDIHSHNQVCDNQLAHAELNALLQFNRRNHDAYRCSIYTTMEPCPLCMGAIYMSGIRQIHYAARDSYAGSTNLLGTTPYLSRKPVKAFHLTQDELAHISLAILVDFQLFRTREMGWDSDELLQTWELSDPVGVRFGRYLWKTGTGQKLRTSSQETPAAYNMLVQHLSAQL